MGWDMHEDGDAVGQLNRSQKIIEYGMALVIPILLALMLYSYVLFKDIFTPLFFLTIVLAVLLMVPAFRALRLHYRCWARNTMPQRLVTGLIGIIYISAASVFGVSVLSMYKGLEPEQPLTFAVLALFALLLIAVMGYNAKFKDRNERTDIRFFRHDMDKLAHDIRHACESHQLSCAVVPNGNSTAINIPEKKVFITIKKQANDSSEVMMECADPIAADLCSEIKRTLDQEA